MHKFIYITIMLLMIGISSNAENITYTFNNAGQTGRLGPSQAQINNAYSSTNLNGEVTSDNGIQIWTINHTGYYTIEAWGAAGADGTYNNDTGSYYRNGGKGARMKGSFLLNEGDQLKILVGQMGVRETSYAHQAGGGGGGTFVTFLDNTPLIIAGGGGGGGNGRYGQEHGGNGLTGTSGGTAYDGPNAAGGTNGSGGEAREYQGSGAGLTGNGDNGVQGAAYVINSLSFVNGGSGGYATSWATNSHGGFGGGGASALLPGGGGGYSGGGASGDWASYGAGAGGGSYNIGTNQDNASGINSGHGLVMITFDNSQIIPEPCSMVLLFFGLLALWKLRLSRA